MSKGAAQALAPGATIGILGGGQLGRMAALAAANLGYKTHIYCPSAGEPASQVTAWTTVAAYDDREALERFAKQVDVVTFEFENVPAITAETLAALVPVRPGPKVLQICQNRVREKDFLTSIGIATAPYAAVSSAQEVAGALGKLGSPAVLKSAEMGYDGKGQVKLDDSLSPETAWREMAGHSAEAGGIVEGFVSFAYEASVIVARGLDGSISCYEPVENRHENHILKQTIVPAPMGESASAKAQEIAHRIAEALDLIGLIGVELFVTAEEDILVNELAPRPHNSGHWTQDGAVTSQFEQFIRAVAGLPLGSPQSLGPAEMLNLLGDEAHDWAEILKDPRAKLHLYGKAEARPGRKMGHVNRLLNQD